MTAMGIPANAKQLAALVKEGEGPALEYKRSTGELKEGMQTLCAFLVIEMCEKHGAAPPVFEEKQGFLVVTLRALLVAGGVAGSSKGRAVPGSGQPESRPELQPESQPESSTSTVPVQFQSLEDRTARHPPRRCPCRRWLTLRQGPTDNAGFEEVREGRGVVALKRVVMSSRGGGKCG